MNTNNLRNKKTFRIALGGICLALAFISVALASFVPGIELTLFAISSLFTAIMIIETGVAGGVLLYVACVLLGLILLPNKLAIIPYAFLFGYYGILKYFMEKIKSGSLQIVIKTIFFATALSIGLLAFASLLASSITLPDYPIWVLIIGGTLLLLLYDMAFTYLINFYFSRFKGQGSDKFKLS